MYLRNCWYMVAWSRDIKQDGITPFMLMNEPLAIYRKVDGTIAVLEDRCCHRLAPLTEGKKEGDGLRCMYHGIVFGPDGICTELPGQTRIPPAVKVRAYPAAERHGAVWVWPGDPAKVDLSLIPPITALDDPEWAMTGSRLDYACNYMLFNDNLLDLSHVPFTHAKTFGAGNAETQRRFLEGETKMEIVEIPRGVRRQTWHLNRPENPYTGKVNTDEHVCADFVVPGVFMLETTVYEAGAVARGDNGKPTEEPILKRRTCQMMTPTTDKTMAFFFNFGPWAKAPLLRDIVFATGAAAFAEDKQIVEAQQRTIDLSPDSNFVPLWMDNAVNKFRSIMSRLIAEEKAA